jgi:hypothetical protein
MGVRAVEPSLLQGRGDKMGPVFVASCHLPKGRCYGWPLVHEVCAIRLRYN